MLDAFDIISLRASVSLLFIDKVQLDVFWETSKILIFLIKNRIK